MTESLGKKAGAAFLKLAGSPIIKKTDSPASLSKSKSLKNKNEQTASLKKKSAEGKIFERNPLGNIDFGQDQSPQTPTTEKVDAPMSPIPISVRRGSVKPSNPLIKAGTLLLRIPEVKSNYKVGKEKKVIYCVISVLGCTLTTAFLPYSTSAVFEEIFEFPVYGDFIIKLEVFVQSEKRNDNQKFDMPESLGTLTFERLSVVQCEKLTGVYFLQKENQDTDHSITLNLAIKIDQSEETDRSKLPEADFKGSLSRQMFHTTGETYSWQISDCELRGRTLTFYSDNKKLKSFEIDSKSKAKKPEINENEEVFPYYCFQVSVKSKPVYLVAQSKESMNEWIAKINKAITSPF